MKPVYERLKAYLSSNEITQVEFATAMGLKTPEIAGRQMVSRWLNGHVTPTRSTRKLIEAFTQQKIKAEDWDKV